jgi:hypothetical protein
MRATALLLVTALLGAACASQPVSDGSQTPSTPSTPATTPTSTSNPPSQTAEGPKADLAMARDRWAAAGLGTYSYQYLDDCGECDQLPVQTAVVWDGEVLDPLRRIASVEEAFALIDAALARGAEVDVTYDRELGYPADLWIDKEARAHDGGTHLVFSAVESGLPGDPASLERHREARARWDAIGLDSYEFSSAVICDCVYQSTMQTRVVDGLVTEFDFRTPEPVDVTITPLAIAQMFDDVETLLSGEDFEDDGIRVTGSALYDAKYGYPVWIGLAIEVLDPEAAAETGFPSRLVMTVSDLAPIESDPLSEVQQARLEWNAQGLDTYTFDIVFHDVETGDFTDEFTVRVVDDVIVSVTQGGTEFAPEEFETIDELFDSIALWQRSGSRVDVIYNTELGYPAVIVALHPDGSSGTLSITLRR